MADVVNLRTARKRAQQKLAEKNAAAHRLVHGKPKYERKLDEARRGKAERDLNGHRIGIGEK